MTSALTGDISTWLLARKTLRLQCWQQYRTAQELRERNFELCFARGRDNNGNMALVRKPW